MIVFDLDGTLIGSERLIRAAYAEAGAEPPEGFLSLGHHGWIPAGRRAAVHAAKDAAYLRLLAEEPPALLPPWQVAEKLHADGATVVLLTSAPEGTAAVLAGVAPSWPFTAAVTARSPAAKANWLEGAGRGVYVDDQRYVQVPLGWRFVHYAGQDAAALHAQVTA